MKCYLELLHLWFYLLVPALSAALLLAQDAASGAIVGTVSDSTGAVIQNSQIKIFDNQTHISRLVLTGSSGIFRASLLPPGNYSITVDAKGFEQRSISSVAVHVGEVTTLSLALAPGKVDISVEVDMLQEQSPALGRVTDERTIQSLPLANRNYTQILALSPGVAVELPNAAQLGKNNQNVSANGAGTTVNNFQFNGVDANNLALNSASGFAAEIGIAVPAPDAIQEFKAQTGGYDAGYGRGSGANVDVISKTGTNHLHGSMWEFFRNDVLNANDFFLKANGQPRPVLKQHQFGFTLGGPIRKDKTYIFGSYQGTVQRNGASSVSLSTAFLPQLTNDRSAATLGAQFCPANHPGMGYQTFAGGTQVACNGSNINPVALNLLNFKFSNGAYAVPSPQTNLPSSDPTQLPIGQSTFSIPAKYREDQFSINLDHALSAKNELSGRFFYSKGSTNEPFSPFQASVPGWGTNALDKNYMFVLADTHAFSASTLNVARFGYMRFDGSHPTAQPINAAQLGTTSPSSQTAGPQIFIDGLFSIGASPIYWQNTNSFIWQDTLSYTHGRHTFRMGPELKRHEVDVNSPYGINGILTMRTFADFLVGQSAAQNGGSMSNIFSSVGTSGPSAKYDRYTDFAAFIQDDIRLNSRVTINAGLRYEIFGPPSEINGRLPTFDPSVAAHTVPASGSLSGFILPANYVGPLPLGAVRSSRSGLWPTQYADISPRIGFAIRLSDKPGALLRGGYGIYYNRMSNYFARTTLGQPPFSFNQSLQGVQNSGATLQQPYDPMLPPDSSFPIFIPRTPSSALFLSAVSPRQKDPYTQQFNLNLQYELRPNILWEIGYVGSTSRHLGAYVQFNQALLASPANPINGQTTNTAANVVQRLPFQGIAQGSYIAQTIFNSGYNSLQTSVTKRLTNGLQFLGSYTWSKQLNTISGGGGLSSTELFIFTNDQTNPRQAYGLADSDRTHRGVLSLVYALPKPAVQSALVQHALSDWTLSTIAVVESGSPITVTDSNAGSIYGDLPGTARAQCTGINPATSGSIFSRVNGYLNPAAFTDAPTVGGDPGSTTFGNCGVGILRGPVQRSIDLAISRAFSLSEYGNLQFRTEFFNLTNTPNFGLPVSNLVAGAAFGRITSTTTNPRIIQFALKYSY